MLENLTEEFVKEKNKIIDKYTIGLMQRAGISVKNNYSNFDLIMVMDDLRREGYEIKFIKSDIGTDLLCLFKKDKIVYGYKFDLRVENDSIKLVVIPIK